MTTKKAFMLMILALVASAAFAQRVGDSVQVFGGSYTVQSVSGDTVTLVRAAQGDGPVNWVAVADSTFGTNSTNNTIRGVAWGNNTWVAVGDAGKIAYSSDGRSWTAIPPGTNAGQSSFGVSNIHAVAFGNNQFVAVGQGGKIAYSADGRSWTAIPPGTGAGQSTFSNNASAAISAVAFGGGRFVTVSASVSRAAYSTDGRTWTAVDAPFAGRAIAWGNNRFVIVGDQGQIAYSSNGQSWTAVPTANNGGGFSTSTVGSHYISGVIYGNNRWVAGGTSGNIAYSSDGASWTRVPAANNGGFGGTNNVYSVGFGNNRFLAVGPSGRIAYSTDAASWTAVANTTFTGNINEVAYGNGRFVAVGQNGRMAYCDW